jgi:hypothetical protein
MRRHFERPVKVVLLPEHVPAKYNRRGMLQIVLFNV